MLVQEAAAYVEMARLVNLAPSCILVYLGAWVLASPSLACVLAVQRALMRSAMFKDGERKVGMQVGGGRRLHALLSPKVALLSAIAGSVAVASCVLNDFFDYSVDVINEPSKVSHSPCLLLASALPCSTSLLSVNRLSMLCQPWHLQRCCITSAPPVTRV